MPNSLLSVGTSKVMQNHAPSCGVMLVVLRYVYALILGHVVDNAFAVLKKGINNLACPTATKNISSY